MYPSRMLFGPMESTKLRTKLFPALLTLPELFIARLRLSDKGRLAEVSLCDEAEYALLPPACRLNNLADGKCLIIRGLERTQHFTMHRVSSLEHASLFQQQGPVTLLALPKATKQAPLHDDSAQATADVTLHALLLWQA